MQTFLEELGKLMETNEGAIGGNDNARSHTGFMGVTLHKRTQRYEAHIWTEKKQVYLGSYTNRSNAARAHDIMALRVKPQASLHYSQQQLISGIDLNFPRSDYTRIEPIVQGMHQADVVTGLRTYSKCLTATGAGAASRQSRPTSAVTNRAAGAYYANEQQQYNQEEQGYRSGMPEEEIPISRARRATSAVSGGVDGGTGLGTPMIDTGTSSRPASRARRKQARPSSALDSWISTEAPSIRKPPGVNPSTNPHLETPPHMMGRTVTGLPPLPPVGGANKRPKRSTAGIRTTGTATDSPMALLPKPKPVGSPISGAIIDGNGKVVGRDQVAGGSKPEGRKEGEGNEETTGGPPSSPVPSSLMITPLNLGNVNSKPPSPLQPKLPPQSQPVVPLLHPSIVSPLSSSPPAFLPPPHALPLSGSPKLKREGSLPKPGVQAITTGGSIAPSSPSGGTGSPWVPPEVTTQRAQEFLAWANHVATSMMVAAHTQAEEQRRQQLQVKNDDTKVGGAQSGDDDDPKDED